MKCQTAQTSATSNFIAGSSNTNAPDVLQEVQADIGDEMHPVDEDDEDEEEDEDTDCQILGLCEHACTTTNHPASGP